jgi:hypothetical protein
MWWQQYEEYNQLQAAGNKKAQILLIHNMAISSGIQAAGNKKAKIKGSYHGSASCCI